MLPRLQGVPPRHGRTELTRKIRVQTTRPSVPAPTVVPPHNRQTRRDCFNRRADLAGSQSFSQVFPAHCLRWGAEVPEVWKEKPLSARCRGAASVRGGDVSRPEQGGHPTRKDCRCPRDHDRREDVAGLWARAAEMTGRRQPHEAHRGGCARRGVRAPGAGSGGRGNRPRESPAGRLPGRATA